MSPEAPRAAVGAPGRSPGVHVSSLAQRERISVVVAYVAFVLTGVSASVGSVVLPAQMTDYDVTRKTIGITFFTFSAGFFLAGTTTGALMARIGTRATLLAGSAAYVAGALYTATRPSFVALVVLQLVAGYGTGLLESVLNAYLTELPFATQRLNRLHAFFGVGALIGPVLATWMLQSWSWPAVWLVLGLAGIPVACAYAATFPARPPRPADDDAPPVRAAALVAEALANGGVALAAVFLTVYVGVEMSVGNWGVNYLQEHRGEGETLAGASLSAYWLGLTAGRFIISPVADALRWTTARMTTACLVGVVGSLAVLGVSPFGGLSLAALALLGFFLGPLFPTAMAVVPRLTTPAHVATAVGLMNAVSVIGGSALPWLAGALGDLAGIGTLVPYVAVLALVQLAVWRGVVRRLDA